MTTNEEAKRELETVYPYLSNEIKLALDKSIEALEKQIAKKPIVAEVEWVSQPVECKCPTCGAYVCKYDTWAKATLKEHHCKCGQAIDWSDDND